MSLDLSPTHNSLPYTTGMLQIAPERQGLRRGTFTEDDIRPPCLCHRSSPSRQQSNVSFARHRRVPPSNCGNELLHIVNHSSCRIPRKLFTNISKDDENETGCQRTTSHCESQRATSKLRRIPRKHFTIQNIPTLPIHVR